MSGGNWQNRFDKLVREQDLDFNFDIRPFDGVGSIKFGMTKQEFAHAFTHVYRSNLYPDKNYRSDYDNIVGLVVHYDNDGKIEEIEIYPNPKYSNARVSFRGVDITDFNRQKAWDFFKEYATDWGKDVYGYTSKSLGLSIYQHNWESENDPVDNYYIWEKGVWE